MKILNKIFFMTVISSICILGNAQTNKDMFLEREVLVKKYGNNKMNISWYVGAVDTNTFKGSIERFLNFSNYLSNKVDKLVILDIFNTDKKAAQAVLNGNYDIVYTSSLIGTQLIDHGWKPILARNEDIQLIVLALESNKKINNEQDFNKTTITTTNGSSIAKTIGYDLIKNKLIEDVPLTNNKNFKPRPVSQEELIEILKSNQTDGILIRAGLAKQLQLKNPGRYKIVYQSNPILGHLLLISPNFDTSKIEQLKSAFKELNDFPKNATILKAIDGVQNDKEKIFKEIMTNEIKSAKELSKINEEFLIQ